jgi:hypothetical protein
VNAKIARIVFVQALLALTACAPKTEVDQLAQHGMIGLSQTRILACLGEPAKRRRVGFEDVWTFPIGQMRNEGGPRALGLNKYSSPFPPSRLCNVIIVIDRYGVSQVRYAGPDDAELPLGQLCEFPVRNCVGP